MKIKRGKIRWIDLNPTVGDEAAKIRPCLILQNDLGNLHSRKTIVAPFLKSSSYPFVVNVTPSQLNNLDRERGLNLSHLRSISCKRVKGKLGKIEDKYWQDIKQAVLLQLGFDEIFNS